MVGIALLELRRDHFAGALCGSRRRDGEAGSDDDSFGGEVRTAVAIDGRGEAQDRTTNQAPHVRIELCHGQLSFTDCLTAAYGLMFATQLPKNATWCAKMQHEI